MQKHGGYRNLKAFQLARLIRDLMAGAGFSLSLCLPLSVEGDIAIFREVKNPIGAMGFSVSQVPAEEVQPACFSGRAQ